MNLKRKRLDEILETSIEDIEKMFCWKIGARNVECPMCHSTSLKGETLHKRSKSDCSSALRSQSSQNSIPVVKMDGQAVKLLQTLVANYTTNRPNMRPQAPKQILWDSLDMEEVDDVPDIGMIDLLIVGGGPDLINSGLYSEGHKGPIKKTKVQ